MIHIIVGHRGSGKSAFLNRVAYYFSRYNLPCHTFDLDNEIVTREELPISEIFKTRGEAGFRDIENQTFANLLREVSPLNGLKFIAVGAGFQGDIPKSCQIIWLRRPTDGDGRIFPDRPRLEPNMDPMAEYQHRYQSRDERFRQVYDRMLTIPEGWESINDFEPRLMGLLPSKAGMSFTLLPEHVARPRRLDVLLQDLPLLGVKFIELRTDLLETEEILSLSQKISADKLLISFRKADPDPRLIELSHRVTTDWALELGPSPLAHNNIVSLHERLQDETVDEAANRLKAQKADHYKLAIEVHNFVELWSGHRFFAENTDQHSFLPRSAQGRWQWYRLVRGPDMHLNFFRMGEGSSADQPLLFDVLRRPKHVEGFAAVLGHPVGHSRTPAEHHDYFAEKQMLTVAVDLNEDECNSLNFSVLERLGLRAAAVTSPLKNKMKSLCQHIDRRAEDLGAVNTISFNEKSKTWLGTNTDVIGLKSVIDEIELPSEICVWGGGGTRRVLKDLLPHARFFSARKGEPIWLEEASDVQVHEPRLVVWAVGRSRLAGTKSPPENWRPEMILDLNYTADSPGLAYAMKVGAKYISGRAMFKAQARAQRAFWK